MENYQKLEKVGEGMLSVPSIQFPQHPRLAEGQHAVY